MSSLTNYGGCVSGGCSSPIYKTVSVMWQLCGWNDADSDMPWANTGIYDTCGGGSTCCTPIGEIPYGSGVTLYNPYVCSAGNAAGLSTCGPANYYGAAPYLTKMCGCLECNALVVDNTAYLTYQIDPVTNLLTSSGSALCTGGGGFTCTPTYNDFCGGSVSSGGAFCVDNVNLNPFTDALTLLATIDLDDLSWGQHVIFLPPLDGSGNPTSTPAYKLFTQPPSTQFGPCFFAGGINCVAGQGFCGYGSDFSAYYSGTPPTCTFNLATKFTALYPNNMVTTCDDYAGTVTCSTPLGDGTPLVTTPYGNTLTLAPRSPQDLRRVTYTKKTC